MHRPSNRRNRALLAVALLMFAVARSASAAGSADASLRQLSNDGIPTSSIDSIVAPQLSPDGQWVVYVHNPTIASAFELYSVGRYGGTPVRLSAQLPAGVQVNWFGISGDGSRVIYQVDQETFGKVELWNVPIGGPASASVKISPPLPAFGDVLIYPFPIMSPDGTHVVFYCDSTSDGNAEVWSAPADAGAQAVRLSPNPVSSGGATFTPAVTADSARVVFTGYFLVDGENMLWSAPLDGSAPAIRLSLIADHIAADVTSFALTPSGKQALYMLDRAIDGRIELFRAPVNGAAGAQLSPISSTKPTSNGDVTGFVIAPDSSRVVFLADLEVDSRVDLWSVPLSGNSADAVIVSPSLVANQEAKDPVFSPDSARVAFLADEGTDNVYNLWSARANGSSAAVRLNPAITATADVGSVAFTSDGARVIYSVRDTAPDPDRRRLWTVPTVGPFTNAAELTTTVLTAGTIGSWTMSPDDIVVMIGALDNASDVELYRVPADGSAFRQTLASSTAVSPIDLNYLKLYAAGSRVLFETNTTTGHRLVDVPIDGSAPAGPIDLHPPNASLGFSGFAQPTAVGDGVLFVGYYVIDTGGGLWLYDRAPTRIFADGFE